jgi:ArsR family transcriptional regulator, arsenate/arsenite/antimonite-responsive transcriptional repressor
MSGSPPVRIVAVVSMAVDMLPYVSTYVNMSWMKLLQEIDVACCPPLLSAPLGEEDAESLAAALQALADPARLRLLSLIASCPGSEACGCDLTTPIGLSQPTVSHHLKVLHEAGLLDRERRGKWVYFKVRPEPLASLRSALSP